MAYIEGIFTPDADSSESPTEVFEKHTNTIISHGDARRATTFRPASYNTLSQKRGNQVIAQMTVPDPGFTYQLLVSGRCELYGIEPTAGSIDLDVIVNGTVISVGLHLHGKRLDFAEAPLNTTGPLNGDSNVILRGRPVTYDPLWRNSSLNNLLLGIRLPWGDE